MANVAVKIGKDATIRRFEARAVQQKIGIWRYPIPGARNFKMVVKRLMPDSNVPKPEI
jgi:hypothetical protein